MLAVPGPLPCRGTWAHEVKWDGHRALARVVDGAVVLTSRGGHDVTRAVPGIAGLAADVGTDALLDGELVALDAAGRPDFGLLQRRIGAGRRGGVTYLVFDVLHLGRTSLLERPLHERRDALEGLELGGPGWAVPAQLAGDTATVLAAVGAQGLEGIVAKETSSAYLPGRRSPAWVKLVHLRKADVVIGGWQPGAGRRAGAVGSLLLGVRDGSGLRYVGNVGTGFTERALRELGAQLDVLSTDRSPFVTAVPAARARMARWVRPELAGEVEMAAWTDDGHLRQPRWRGLRDGSGHG